MGEHFVQLLRQARMITGRHRPRGLELLSLYDSGGFDLPLRFIATKLYKDIGSMLCFISLFRKLSPQLDPMPTFREACSRDSRSRIH